jgi:hypothetical protein
VIELDDKTHLRPVVQKSDAFKNAVLEAAGMPSVRAKVGRYDGLRAMVNAAVG